jgi:hypothetical protein
MMDQSTYAWCKAAVSSFDNLRLFDHNIICLLCPRKAAEAVALPKFCLVANYGRAGPHTRWPPQISECASKNRVAIAVRLGSIFRAIAVIDVGHAREQGVQIAPSGGA